METMKNSAQPRVRALLAAGGGMGSRAGLLVRALPFMVAAGNIVTLAYFERYLGEPANRDALLLVAFLQSIQLLLFAFLRLSGPTTEVLSKTALDVVSESDKTASLDVQADSVKRWNVFLEQATGFTSKERSKRLQKKAKEGKL